jgi:hypothetical protein
MSRRASFQVRGRLTDAQRTPGRRSYWLAIADSDLILLRVRCLGCASGSIRLPLPKTSADCRPSELGPASATPCRSHSRFRD